MQRNCTLDDQLDYILKKKEKQNAKTSGVYLRWGYCFSISFLFNNAAILQKFSRKVFHQSDVHQKLIIIIHEIYTHWELVVPERQDCWCHEWYHRHWSLDTYKLQCLRSWCFEQPVEYRYPPLRICLRLRVKLRRSLTTRLVAVAHLPRDNALLPLRLDASIVDVVLLVLRELLWVRVVLYRGWICLLNDGCEIFDWCMVKNFTTESPMNVLYGHSLSCREKKLVIKFQGII